MGKFVDLTGKVFGRLEVLQKSDKRSGVNSRLCWECRCSCGNLITTAGQNLTRGDTKSCGCLKIEPETSNRLTHGLSHDKLYSTWNNMIYRCTREDNISYKDYGGRGIKVCDRWLDVVNFVEDMGYPSDETLTLERVDVDGDYNKDNCVWANASIQVFNQRKGINNSSGKVGVTFKKKAGKWVAFITKNYKYIYLGIYEDIEDAIAARKAAEKELYGFYKKG